jgi:hypothetical protein
MEKLNKYQRSKIYKVVDTSYTECYIGSSTQRFLCNRMASHRANYKLWKHNQYANCAVFSLFDKYGVDNCKIELIESYPCESLEELRRREGHWIKSEECINKRVAGRTDLEYYYDNIEKFKEYQERNKEQISERKKEYYQAHIEDIKQYRREYQITHKDRLKEKKRIYYETNQDKIKQYREDNKERIVEYRKQYAKPHYEANKDIINEKRKETTTCETCGVCYRTTDKARHEKTQRHLNALENDK